jgi:hypothetical protein
MEENITSVLKQWLLQQVLYRQWDFVNLINLRATYTTP